MRKTSSLKSFRDLIGCWDTVAQFAREIGVKYQTARKMNDRNSIDVDHWSSVMEAAKRRGIRITVEDLVRMKSPEGKRRSPRPSQVAA